jgi:hypothetical protein
MMILDYLDLFISIALACGLAALVYVFGLIWFRAMETFNERDEKD